MTGRNLSKLISWADWAVLLQTDTPVSRINQVRIKSVKGQEGCERQRGLWVGDIWQSPTKKVGPQTLVIAA